MSESEKRRRNDKLPDWFPLPIYSELLDPETWHKELTLRLGFQTAHRNGAKSSLHGLIPAGAVGFVDVFVNRSLGSEPSGDPAPKIEWPISEPSVFELLYLAEGTGEHREARVWAKRLVSEPRTAILEFFDSEFYKGGFAKPALEQDLAPIIEPAHWRDVLGRRVPVMIDLDIDDRSLLAAFEIWLVAARAIMEEDYPKRIDERALARFKKFGLLPAFDLQFWAEVNQLNYTDAFIAKALWPDTDVAEDFVDVTERYRKLTKPLIEDVFRWDFIEKFGRQLELGKSLDRLVEKRKVKHKNQNSIPE
jgi:hypothetical protein